MVPTAWFFPVRTRAGPGPGGVRGGREPDAHPRSEQSALRKPEVREVVLDGECPGSSRVFTLDGGLGIGHEPQLPRLGLERLAVGHHAGDVHPAGVQQRAGKCSHGAEHQLIAPEAFRHPHGHGRQHRRWRRRCQAAGASQRRPER